MGATAPGSPTVPPPRRRRPAAVWPSTDTILEGFGVVSGACLFGSSLGGDVGAQRLQRRYIDDDER